MHKPGSMPAAAAASLFAIVAISGFSASPAAADTCLTAPNGPTPKGQHWYYHLDHAKNRKCWYLRAVGGAAAPTATASPQADAQPPKRSVATPSAPPAAAAAQPAPTAMTAAPARAPAPASPPEAAQAAAPPVVTPAPAPAQNAASVWPASPPRAATGGQEADAAGAAPTAAPPVAQMTPAAPVTATATPAPAKPDVPVEKAAPPAPHAAPAVTSSNGLAANALIAALAAILALAVFAMFVVARRRRRAPAIDVESRVPGPRFGSKPDPRDRGLFRIPDREAPPLQAAPIEGSLVPEQVTMTQRATR
jgi:hypothetical protein